ncbi:MULTISPECIES: hypothetical protein [unclassified Nocardia]|uniref:hypothetical protein n=1 Tax=unclassified Nocardia TaxID=2637762 RepID=UPI00343B51A5
MSRQPGFSGLRAAATDRAAIRADARHRRVRQCGGPLARLREFYRPWNEALIGRDLGWNHH